MKTLNLKGISLSGLVAILASFAFQFAAHGDAKKAMAEVVGLAFPLFIAWISGVPVKSTVDLDGDGKADFPRLPGGF